MTTAHHKTVVIVKRHRCHQSPGTRRVKAARRADTPSHKKALVPYAALAYAQAHARRSLGGRRHGDRRTRGRQGTPDLAT